MPVTERVARLREQSLQTLVTLSTERADLLTEFYRQDLGPVSAPVRRALAFRYLMAHQTIYIGDGELIVGEKGPFPKAAPLPRTLRPLSGGPGYSQFAGKDSLRRQPGGPPGLRRGHHPLLARQIHARPHLPGDDRRVEICLRGRHLH